MRGSLRFTGKSAILLLLSIVLVFSACAPPAPVDESTPLIPQTGPTEPEPTTQPTELEPTETPLQIALTAVSYTAKVFKNGATETDVEQDQKVSIEANDRIEVVKLENQEKQSHSVLDFADFLTVELFTNAVVLLQDVREEAGGSTHVTLNLSRGHMFVELTDETNSRVTVETPDATINTLEDGTEFRICKAPDSLTCAQVKKGSVEIIAQGKKEIVREGEASFIFKDGPPSPIICAPNEIFIDWEEQFREKVATPPLGAMVAGLRDLCGWQSVELPSAARKLYQDLFTNPLGGWLQTKNDTHFIGYSTPEYYHVQAQSAGDKAVVYVPAQRQYEDANIDVTALTGNAQNGDFRYGVVFRRSGDNYFAFAISPVTQSWYVLKNSAEGEEIIKDGTNDAIESPETENTLRVMASGPTFTFFINGRLVYQFQNADYPRGEIGLLVQTLNSPNALIYFDSITIWDMQGSASNSTSLTKENCFNNRDDDGDHFVDRDDPDCNRPDILTSITPVNPSEPGPPPVTECAPPEEDPQCPESNPYDPAICDCGDFVPGGCTDPTATNYDPDAPYDDGSCEYEPEDVYGCTDPNATNYNPSATVNDGTCQYPSEPVPGCTDPNATNYDPNATVNDGSCQYPPESQPVSGCTDPNATNYDPNATNDNGSCTYG
ncbi:MAG TPA: hypothetical protein VK897_16285 [Anaerolineales bacterium]|nr:hypothetical protein [Anaerolineales bacterium]